MNVDNKMLAVLLVAAIVVSLGGTIVVLNIGDGIIPTGYAAQSNVTASVHYNVSSNVVLLFTDDSLQFGTGYVNTSGGATNCSLTTETSGNSASCVDFTSEADSPLILENIGNKEAYLNFTFTDNLTAGFIQEASSLFKIKVTNNRTDACTTNGLSNYTDATTFDNTDEIAVCALFDSDPAHNSVDIDVNLTIDMFESGNEIVTLRAIGTEI